MRLSLVIIVLLGAVALMGCRGRAKVDPEPEPEVDPTSLPMKYRDYNLVFVSFDALQARHVGALGYARDVTPNLDAFAKRSFNFTRAYSVASWTVPASMSWFTGVYPSEHGMTNKFAVYKADEKKQARLKDVAPHLLTLAEVLKQQGYATAGFTGNAGVSGGFGYEQGFDIYDHEPNKFGGFDRSIPRAIEWLKKNKDHKFFLFLHGYDVHGQSTPAGGFDYRFVEKGYDGRYTGSEQEQETLREEGLAKGKLAMRPVDITFWRAIYDEKIHRADARFRRFLDEFARLGLTERTLFVLTSDHGTEFCEHGRFDHGFTLYNEMIHVPLIVRLPGQRSGTTISDRVGSIDVLPTMLDLLDVPLSPAMSKQLRGTSLVPALGGERVKRDVFSETDYRQYTYKRSIITPDGWKLIVTLEKPARELYEINGDPDETHDLAKQELLRADELQRRLYAHFKSIGHDLTARRWEVGLNPVYPSQEKKAKE